MKTWILTNAGNVELGRVTGTRADANRAANEIERNNPGTEVTVTPAAWRRPTDRLQAEHGSADHRRKLIEETDQHSKPRIDL